ncbi:MAG: SurA N-terminal domain-containing protein [Deltaproteobacteria bacterium]|nr:SurA N-terminal domain-containing protein [Deltaproteobacteria bacterium]
MLRLMRDYATSWLIKILLGAIVIVFVFWGVGSFRSRKASVIASVNGDIIDAEEYNSTYNALLEQMRQRFGNNMNQEVVKMLRLDQQALAQLIDQTLMVQEAAKLKLRVTDAEIVDAITGVEAFQTNGQFDLRLYQRVLEYNRMTPEGFEKIQKTTLLTSKLRAYVGSNIQVSDGEALAYYQWQNTSVDIEYFVFEPDKYKDVETSEEEIQAFFEKSKTAYKTDPMVDVQYIQFNPEAYKDTAEVTDPEIRDYYNTNIREFDKPKTVEARHILIKVALDAGEADVALARARAVEILDMYKAGTAFPELATQYSEGPSKNNGGYLGNFKKEDMVAPFAEQAFSMAPGEVSEPVKTQFGWHLIQVEKVDEASTQSLEEASGGIREKLAGEKAGNLAYDAAEFFFDQTLEGDDLARITQETDLTAIKTGRFSRQGASLKGIADRSKFITAAFELTLNQISEIQDFSDGYFILQVIETVPGKIPELASVKETVAADLKKEKQQTRAREAAEALLEALKNDTEEGAVAFVATGFFKRNASIPTIGYENEISTAAFMLTPDNSLPEKAFKGTKGYYVIRLKNRKLPDAEGFDKEREEIKESLLVQKQSRTFNAWLAQIKDNSEITIKEGVVE